MKLLRYGEKGKEKPGILDSQGQIRDISKTIDDIKDKQLHSKNLEKIKELDLSSLNIVKENVRIGPCVSNIGKFICIGLNYSDHAKETNMEIPTEPIIFSKYSSAVIGPVSYTHLTLPTILRV